MATIAKTEYDKYTPRNLRVFNDVGELRSRVRDLEARNRKNDRDGANHGQSTYKKGKQIHQVCSALLEPTERSCEDLRGKQVDLQQRLATLEAHYQLQLIDMNSHVHVATFEPPADVMATAAPPPYSTDDDDVVQVQIGAHGLPECPSPAPAPANHERRQRKTRRSSRTPTSATSLSAGAPVFATSAAMVLTEGAAFSHPITSAASVTVPMFEQAMNLVNLAVDLPPTTLGLGFAMIIVVLLGLIWRNSEDGDASPLVAVTLATTIVTNYCAICATGALVWDDIVASALMILCSTLVMTTVTGVTKPGQWSVSHWQECVMAAVVITAHWVTGLGELAGFTLLFLLESGVQAVDMPLSAVVSAACAVCHGYADLVWRPWHESSRSASRSPWMSLFLRVVGLTLPLALTGIAVYVHTAESAGLVSTDLLSMGPSLIATLLVPCYALRAMKFARYGVQYGWRMFVHLSTKLASRNGDKKSQQTVAATWLALTQPLGALLGWTLAQIFGVQLAGFHTPAVTVFTLLCTAWYFHHYLQQGNENENPVWWVVEGHRATSDPHRPGRHP
jgi:hypothetical protein